MGYSTVDATLVLEVAGSDLFLYIKYNFPRSKQCLYQAKLLDKESSTAIAVMVLVG